MVQIDSSEAAAMREAVDAVTSLGPDMHYAGSAHSIARYRWGLEDGEPHTYEQTGQRFGISRERARQVVNRIEQKALERLRATK